MNDSGHLSKNIRLYVPDRAQLHSEVVNNRLVA